MILKKNQIKLFNKIINFIKQKHDKILLVEGEAGSGKTSTVSYTLNKMILKNFLKKYCFFFLTPTNAAKKVLRNFVIDFIRKNKESYLKYEEYCNIYFQTIHSFFKSRQQFTEEGEEYFKLEYSNNSLNDYIQDTNKKHHVKKFILIIDECSMLDEKKVIFFQRLINNYNLNNYNLKIIFMGDRNQLSFIKKIAKIITRIKKNVIKNKFTFKLYQSDFRIHEDIRNFFIDKMKEKHLFIKLNEYLGTDFLKNNIHIIRYDDIVNHKQIIIEDCPKFITYSNKKRNQLNNHIRNIIYKNDPYKDEYLFLENEKIIFEKNYENIFFNTDEFILKRCKYNISETINFFNIFQKVFTIQTCMIIEDNYFYQFKQIKKSELDIFILIIRIIKRIIKNYFNKNKLLSTTIDITQECIFCEQIKSKFKKYSQNEYLCYDCYFKINQYINHKFFSMGTKKKLYNVMYKEVQDISNKYNLPIKYSYSITCYKSQGGSYKNVVIDYKNIYMCNKNNIENLTRSLYVSISRTQEQLFFLDYFK
jgi:hypothetical protein